MQGKQSWFMERLRLPVVFFHGSPKEVVDYNDYLSRLRDHMLKLRPTPALRHGSSPVFISKGLMSSPQVFVRQDAVRKPFQAPYTGPFKVIEQHGKYFKIDVKGKTTTVSIDRLKPAYLLSEPVPGEEI